MKCMICKSGETADGKTIVTLNREETVIVFKSVPCQVCNNCGEKYIEQNITESLLNIAEEVNSSGVQVDIREYKAA
ncbi:MAG: type II toxin-antitoxin system MqsA family antitoxin [Bacteroidetes bacterium]|nr:type II toxin-antitoxin system MqsA family antitoxin [Bacteroidota bacterium]